MERLRGGHPGCRPCRSPAAAVPHQHATEVRVSPLGALSMAWVAAEAAAPIGWHMSGLYRFGEQWIALPEGPEWDHYASCSSQYPDQALRRLSDRLRERRGSASGG